MTVDRGLPGLFQQGEEWTDRWLSAAAHRSEQFARVTAAELTEDRLTALGPSLGVDLVAVARHARAAVRRANLRDGLLAALLVAWAVPAALLVHRARLGQPVGPQLLGLLGVLAAAWTLVLVTEHRARTMVFRVIDGNGPPPDRLAPPLDPELESRLSEQARTNVLPYHEPAERTNPFVGSGEMVEERVWQPIDISTPAKDPAGGGELPIVGFDVVDLHAFVAREMGDIAGLEGLRARNRLYVRGAMTRHAGKELLPDPLRAPRTTIPEGMVEAGLTRPGLGMRTYLCLEGVGQGGRVIVSMHLRARVQHPRLSWEVTTHVVPPLREEFLDVRRLRQDPFGHWWSLWRLATGEFLPALFKVPARLWRRGRARALRSWRLWRARWAIGKQYEEFDYGADGSIRARAAVSLRLMEFSDTNDAVDFLQRLRQGVLTATEQFLKAHHIDTASFEQAQQVINHHSYTFHGTITGQGFNFGGQGTVHLTGTGTGTAPGHGQGQGPGGPSPSPSPAPAGP
ncbi:hypothetical protein ABTX82_13215 [Streptomyces lavendulae]|uniref:hypothetical protein n=1 Tax=Streptomyces lavendulae TaxID=1914 RepID=UPI00331BA752